MASVDDASAAAGEGSPSQSGMRACGMSSTRGMSVFQDIFRRADKNDDGRLSFEEFQAYFSDGVLQPDQMLELFRDIDTHQTDNLSTDELCEYFSRHLGAYGNVLSALEQLNHAILRAMDCTKRDYADASVLQQFVTRFLLRETCSQLQSLQGSLECATEAVERQTCPGRVWVGRSEVASVSRTVRKTGRRSQKNNGLSPSDGQHRAAFPVLSPDFESPWNAQLSRLEKLLDKLETKELKLEPLEEEEVEGSDAHVLLVQRQMPVQEEHLEAFRQALRLYAEHTMAEGGCLYIAVQKLAVEAKFVIYQFWENSSLWKSHQQTGHSRSFQRSMVDQLESPEAIATMLVPASWWTLNSN
ncbi:N-terminal EF-hand calcium-binding protein 1-like [Lampetra fluviatilis]